MSPPPTSCNESASPEQTRWFVEEVHPHDAALKSYLRGSFPALRDIDDIAQESYVTIWRRRAADPIRSARAFLFNIARHIALDTLRRQRRSPCIDAGDGVVETIADAAPGVRATLGHDERCELLVAAIEALPARCRAVVVLRKLRLLSQRETAAQLGISERGVEKQLARGLGRCREFLRRRGVTDFLRHEP